MWWCVVDRSILKKVTRNARGNLAAIESSSEDDLPNGRKMAISCRHVAATVMQESFLLWIAVVVVDEEKSHVTRRAHALRARTTRTATCCAESTNSLAC
jgi:hypothetical protein